MNDHSATHQLSGSEEFVAYLPGDNFTGVSVAWLVDHLMVDPRAGTFTFNDDADIRNFTPQLDGEDVDLDEFPVGPNGSRNEVLVATLGNPSGLYPDMVALTLHFADPWLISVWSEVETTYIPVVNPSTLSTHIWDWIVRFTAEWAQIHPNHDLPIECHHVNTNDAKQLQRLADSANGATGKVTINGVQIHPAMQEE